MGDTCPAPCTRLLNSSQAARARACGDIPTASLTCAPLASRLVSMSSPSALVTSLNSLKSAALPRPTPPCWRPASRPDPKSSLIFLSMGAEEQTPVGRSAVGAHRWHDGVHPRQPRPRLRGHGRRQALGLLSVETGDGPAVQQEYDWMSANVKRYVQGVCSWWPGGRAPSPRRS